MNREKWTLRDNPEPCKLQHKIETAQVNQDSAAIAATHKYLVRPGKRARKEQQHYI